MKNFNEQISFEIEELPELDTEVGISRSTKQQEVGGSVCLGIAVGIAVYGAL